MKLDNGLAIEEESIGTNLGGKVGGMNSKNLAKFIDIITTQLYKDPEGTIVRELTSNCFDAHIKFQKQERIRLEDNTYEYNEPVIVAYTEEEGQGFISFIDRGTGISPEDMDNIYIEIGTSDKDEDDDFLGAFGVGSKSFLSYTPSVDLVTITGGVKYSYIVFKNSKGLLEYNLLMQEMTDEHSGTTVKVCLGNVVWQTLDTGHSSNYGYKAEDYRRFRAKVIEQLHYFDNVYTSGFELDNNYQLYEADWFKIRTGNNPFKEMHVILGKVYYPIDWQAISMDTIFIPVGIKFNIGELSVTSSRENLKYNDVDRNQLIAARVTETINEIRDRYNKNCSTVDTLEEYITHLESPVRQLIIKDCIIPIPTKLVWNSKKGRHESIDVIENLLTVKWTPIAHLPIQVPKDPYCIFQLKGYIEKVDGKGNAVMHYLTSEEIEKQFETVNKPKYTVYRIKGERNKITDAYLNWKHKNSQTYPLLIGKTINKYSFWESLLDLGKKLTKQVSKKGRLDDRKQIRTPFIDVVKGKLVYLPKFQIIKEFKAAITKDLVSRSQSYDKIVPSAEYLSELQLAKQAKKKKKLEGRITIYDVVNRDGKATELDLSTLEYYTGLIIYAEKEKSTTLRNVRDLLTSQQDKTKRRKGHRRVVHNFLSTKACRVFMTAKSNFKLLQNNPYFMHVDEFLSNNNKIFRNVVTAWYVSKELDNIFNSYPELWNNLESINEKLYKKRAELRGWSGEHYISYVDIEFMYVCYNIGIEKNMLWTDKLAEVEQIKEWFLNDLIIFKYIEKQAYQKTESFADIISILKMKKKRLSPIHYQPEVIQVPQVKVEKKMKVVEYQLLTEPINNKLLIYQ